MTTHVIQGLFHGRRSFLACNRSYSRPQYYWSTLPENAEKYSPNVNILGKVRSTKLREQVTDMKVIPLTDAKSGYED